LEASKGLKRAFYGVSCSKLLVLMGELDGMSLYCRALFEVRLEKLLFMARNNDGFFWREGAQGVQKVVDEGLFSGLSYRLREGSSHTLTSAGR
jgi:hypothetical protein